MTIGVLALALLLPGACRERPSSVAADPYAGLDRAILAWKADIVAHDPSCRAPPAGQKCEMFEVSCKAQRTISPGERAAGVTARLVADMTWSGFDAKGAARTAAADALFEKVGGAWRRSAYGPVNPESCADL